MTAPEALCPGCWPQTGILVPPITHCTLLHSPLNFCRHPAQTTALSLALLERICALQSYCKITRIRLLKSGSFSKRLLCFFYNRSICSSDNFHDLISQKKKRQLPSSLKSQKSFHTVKENQRLPVLYLDLFLHMFNPQGTMDAENYSFVTFVWLPERKND